MTGGLPNVVALNLHKRFTGISSTIRFLLPHQRRDIQIGLIDWGSLGIRDELSLWQTVMSGFRRPEGVAFRVWHARRDIDMAIGILLRDVFRQRWRLMFTSAANRRPGRTLNFLINRMDAVVAACGRSAGFLDWHSAVIHHGVDTDFFHPPNGGAQENSDVMLPGKYIVGTFGRIRHSKGTDLFVDALTALLPEFEDFSAAIAGLCRPQHREFKASLEEKIAHAGLQDRIVFLGDIDSTEMVKWLQRVNLCVAPSRVEGFGLTPIEAFACGTPVVASSVGVWPEIVGDGVGAVFASGDVDDLVAKLRPLLANVEQLAEMGTAARNQVVATHSVHAEAEALNKIYEVLMNGDSLAKIKAGTSERNTGV